MPTRIRLSRTGRRNAPAYRVVVADSRAPRDGKYIDLLGYYNPLRDPPEINIDQEKALKWLRKGAEPTETARSLLRRVGVLRAFEQERDAQKRARAGIAQAEQPAEPAEEPSSGEQTEQ